MYDEVYTRASIVSQSKQASKQARKHKSRTPTIVVAIAPLGNLCAVSRSPMTHRTIAPSSFSMIKMLSGL